MNNDIIISIDEEEKMSEEEKQSDEINSFYKNKDEFEIQGNIYGKIKYNKVSYKDVEKAFNTQYSSKSKLECSENGILATVLVRPHHE
jgi:hypothetical protein